MTTDFIIRFNNIKKAFGPNVVYTDFTLDIQRHETITIMGGSGTGKSVALKLLIGLLKPDDGSILVDGADVVPLSEEQLIPVRRKISMLFQGGALFDSMTVFENIAYPLREHLNLSEEEIKTRVLKNLGMVGLPDSAYLMPAELSGGMKKRIGLARAIAIEPEVILYDEPTTGLDPSNTRRINELIIKMQAELGVTSIVVTHDMPSAFMVSDRIAMLHDKKITAVLTKEEARDGDVSLVKNFVEGRMEDL